MQSIRRTAACAAVIAACVSWASPAHADDDFRAIIREEIAAYMAGEKAAKQAEKPAKEEKKADDGNVFKVYWKNGLRLDTKDKNVKLKIGGRIFFDGWVFSDDDYQAVTGQELSDGVEFRALRIYNSGQIGKHVKFKAQFDFAPVDSFTLKDVYIELTNLADCIGCGAPDIRFGHFFAPYSLEAQTSSKYITFMERSAATSVFAPSRLSGVALSQSWLGDQLQVSAGAFAEGTGSGGGGLFEEDGWSAAARVAWTPWWDCDCKCNRLQIGASVWSRHDMDTWRYRARPNVHVTGYRVVDSRVGTASAGDFAADSALHWGLETLFTYGPWSIQAEYFAADVDSPMNDDPMFTGWYAYVSYWLTGECRPLKHGKPGRVSPCCNFLDEDCCCKGGWEIAARVDSVDLTDGAIDGGEAMSYTLGVNWHLNPNMRIMWNLLVADVDRGKNSGNVTIPINESFIAFGMRVQVDW